MTKKEKRERDKKQRTLIPFNIGVRIFKNKRDYQRKKKWTEED